MTSQVTQQQEQVQQQLQQPKFSILSWNLLAPIYCRTSGDAFAYSYLRPEHVAFSHRRELILDELRKTNCDIYCLQEVQYDLFEADFKPFFEALGYSCIIQRSKNSKKDHPVGNCTAFRKSLFVESWSDHRSRILITGLSLVSPSTPPTTDAPLSDKVESDTLIKESQLPETTSLPPPPSSSVEPLTLTSSPTSSAGSSPLVSKKGSRSPSPRRTPSPKAAPHCDLVIANVHLEAMAKSASKRVSQLQSLLERLNSPHKVEHVPLLIVGDFNSDLAHGIGKYLLTQELDPEFMEFDIQLTSVPLKHSFMLKSVYDAEHGPLTFRVPMQQDPLDHIIYTSHSLTLLSCTNPEDLVPSKDAHLPNEHWPSDHLYISASFALHASSS